MKNANQNKQAKIDLDIFYPTINNIKVWETANIEGPVIKVIAIKEEGLIFISKVPVNISDFVSFLMKVGETTSFNCLVAVEEVREKKEQYIAFCKFYLLSDNQSKAIKKYISEN